MAPEVLKGKYTKQADVWSIGVIAYMLMSSQMPFYGRKRIDIMEKIVDGYVPMLCMVRWRSVLKAQPNPARESDISRASYSWVNFIDAF
jgi:serine/threonine protein kinase